MKFIKHMVDNYEVEIKLFKNVKNNLRIKIVNHNETYEWWSILNDNYTFKSNWELKELMNNEDGYFKERE